MKAKNIIEAVEQEYPKALAYDWDNPGLMVGSPEKEVKILYITLDVNLETVQEAAELGADMILSHHPMFYRPIRHIWTDAPAGKMTALLLKHEITVYAAHTNMDVAPRGINQRLAELFGFREIRPLEQHPMCEQAGLGRIGLLPEPVELDAFVKTVQARLNTPVRVSGDAKKLIRCGAVASGSCSEVVPEAIRAGADVIVTADLKYHETMDFAEQGICLIDAGHYPTEIMTMDLFENIVPKEEGLRIVKSSQKDVFRFSV